MNIIKVLRLPTGTKLSSNLEKDTIYEVCSSFGKKCLKIKANSKTNILTKDIIVSLDSDVTEANFTMINEKEIVAMAIAEVKKTGKTNMFISSNVIDILEEMNYFNEADYIRENKDKYIELLKLSSKY